MLIPDWPLPLNVAIAFTDRHGGCSLPPFDSLNLGLHVGDLPKRVKANREQLVSVLHLPSEPLWLEQVHGVEVVSFSDIAFNAEMDQPVPVADGSYANQYGQVCAVMTADCLPILLCDKQGQQVAAVHAGWRGLCAGIIEQAVKRFSVPASELIACLGPAIGPKMFEVGAEVKSAFVAQQSAASNCFIAQTGANDKYLADIVGLAKLRLAGLGVNCVYSVDECTMSNPNYFSYRREKQTGRMASLIWLKS